MRTHCSRGHEMIGDNIYISPSDKKRRCKICRRESWINYAVRKGLKDDPKSSAKTGAWSKVELEDFHRMVSEGKTPDQIAQELGRSRLSVQSRIQRENMTEDQRKAHRAKKLEWSRRNNPFAKPRDCREYINAADLVAKRPSHELLKEAQQRSLAPHRSLTSAFLGDPPIGYSALDRRPGVC